jgi:centromeric protein E
MLSLKRNTGDIDIVKVLKQNETLKSEVCRLRSILDSGMTSYTDATSFQIMKTEERDIPSSNKEDVHYELIAENNILNEQVEHLKRLQIEDNLIRSKQCDDDLSSLNEILTGLILDANTRRTCDELVGRIGRNHREYDLRLQEQDSYVGHLENRIRISEIENARHKPVLSPRVTPVTTASAAESPTYDRELIEELQEELAELKRSMQRKDAMIRALQRTGNV